jgi:molybdenum cofactor synthesis domain-containing protein
MEWNLLEKTTFWVEGVELESANLEDVAAAAAQALGFQSREVMVVDVQPGLVAFDILRKSVPAESVAGKGNDIIINLSGVRGVRVSSNTSIHSEGVLGFIAIDPETAQDVLSRSAEIGRNVAEAISKRVCVFATGSEVISGKIEDTNSPFLIETLNGVGFKAEFGGFIEDSTPAAVAALESALMRGFGLLITTGGVGAESKDHSVEAILKMDPKAATSWILKFTPDMKRHHKEGVRIAVGRVGMSRIIALPGPHVEVRVGCRAFIEANSKGQDDAALAESIASAIRKRWSNHMGKEREK